MNKDSAEPTKKVLVVDDIEDNVELLSYDLQDDGFEVSACSSGKACLDYIRQQPVDIILLDINMPGQSGLETLEIITKDEQLCDIPVIMVSGDRQQALIVQALDLGAHDFVSKPIEYPVLAARMRSALRLKEAQHALELANVNLEYLASHDPLTNTYNRREFISRSQAEFAKAGRYKRPLSVIMIDIDDFKAINDHYGHQAGDQTLSQLVGVFQKSVRESDILGRIGGEEFAICCPESDLEGSYLVAERLRKSCEQVEVDTGETSVKVTISAGVAQMSEEDKRLDDMINRADHLLYEAKKQGKNRVISHRQHLDSDKQ